MGLLPLRPRSAFPAPLPTWRNPNETRGRRRSGAAPLRRAARAAGAPRPLTAPHAPRGRPSGLAPARRPRLFSPARADCSINPNKIKSVGGEPRAGAYQHRQAPPLHAPRRRIKQVFAGPGLRARPGPVRLGSARSRPAPRVPPGNGDRDAAGAAPLLPPRELFTPGEGSGRGHRQPCPYSPLSRLSTPPLFLPF